MSDFLSYVYTVFSRLWDLLSYPFEAAGQAVDFVNGAWHYTTDILSMFPAWATASVTLVFALGIVLFIISR